MNGLEILDTFDTERRENLREAADFVQEHVHVGENGNPDTFRLDGEVDPAIAPKIVQVLLALGRLVEARQLEQIDPVTEQRVPPMAYKVLSLLI